MVTKEQVEEKLKEVYDPEVGINIVDLGLVYDIEVANEKDVHVIMTLTTPGCPLHGSITGGAKAAVESVEGVGDVNVELVWEPRWTPDRLTEEARRQLSVR